jgi:ribosome-binding protein aMBF1 (putative translation factor)
MSERSGWHNLRGRRTTEPGAAEVYERARLAHELGQAVRGLREEKGWSQRELAVAARMTQPAVARFEAGGTTPTLPVLERLANALDVELVVRLGPRSPAA